MAAAIAPPGSTRSSGVNHHGTPFCRLTTHVSGPSRHPRRGSNCGKLCAFTAKRTTSAGPMDARSPLERVDPGGAIAAAIEARRVVGSLVYFATEIAEPGVVRHIEGHRISIGEPDGVR